MTTADTGSRYAYTMVCRDPNRTMERPQRAVNTTPSTTFVEKLGLRLCHQVVRSFSGIGNDSIGARVLECEAAVSFAPLHLEQV